MLHVAGQDVLDFQRASDLLQSPRQMPTNRSENATEFFELAIIAT